MELNEYQKQVLLSMLNDRVIEEQNTIDRLTQTINHNKKWLIPLAENIQDKSIINIQNIVLFAKRDIDTNEKDLIQIKELIEKIKNLLIN